MPVYSHPLSSTSHVDVRSQHRPNGRANEAAIAILDAFRHPEQLPAKMASIFIHRNDLSPCRKWSWSNQFITAIHGHSDARGFRQWREVGRHVKKGEKGFAILVPLCKKIGETTNDKGEKEPSYRVYGFKHAIVFGLEQTEGEPLPVDQAVKDHLDSLPWVEVARQWGLSVDAYNGEGAGYLGFYSPANQAIAVGVTNLSTWAHEPIHAADDRLNGLETKQRPDQEIVAELGGAVLLKCLGHDHQADLGGCFAYCQAQAEKNKPTTLGACTKLLDRVCRCVDLILTEASNLESGVTA